MQIQSFLHTALTITNLEKSEHFYSHILGLKKVGRNLKFPGIWYQIGDYQLHLIVAPNNPPSDNQAKWGRNRHIAFAVANVAMVQQRLNEAGQPFQLSSSGRPALFVRDPDDNVIELGEI